MEKINSPQKKAVIDDRKTPHMNNLDSKVTNFGDFFLTSMYCIDGQPNGGVGKGSSKDLKDSLSGSFIKDGTEVDVASVPTSCQLAATSHSLYWLLPLQQYRRYTFIPLPKGTSLSNHLVEKIMMPRHSLTSSQGLVQLLCWLPTY